jgi:hypothetical protein
MQIRGPSASAIERCFFRPRTLGGPLARALWSFARPNRTIARGAAPDETSDIPHLNHYARARKRGRGRARFLVVQATDAHIPEHARLLVHTKEPVGFEDSVSIRHCYIFPHEGLKCAPIGNAL